MSEIDFYKNKAKELGISQYKLAKMCGVTPQQISSYWTGKANVGMIMESKLIKALNITKELK